MSSMKLRELIRAVRLCKTAAEERGVVSKECALIRNSFKEEQIEYRSRNIAKLLFINLLGYSTPFAQVECLKLIASGKYADKRIGYLGLTQLLCEDSEVLMMVTNSIKIDLNLTQNHFIVALALTAIGEISTPEMCRELFPEIKKLIQGTNAYIKKKATLTAVRIIKKVPEMVEDFSKIIEQLLQDKTHGSMLSAMALLNEIMITEKKYKRKFRKLVTVLVKALRGLLVSGYAPDYDISGVTDPFLQVAILKVLTLFGENNIEASDEMSDVLAHLATNTETTKNPGNAILYECVKTIMAIESNQGLRVLGINILGRFLLNRENNIKFVALVTLKKVVQVDYNAVQRHRSTILECVKDHDISIRKGALDLLYQIINGTNIKSIVKELINILLIADSDFKNDLTSKICMCIEKYAPSRKWHIDTVIKVLTLAGNHTKEEFISYLIHLISATPELQPYAVHRSFFSLKENLHQEGLVILGVWLIGEFGEHLLQGKMVASDETPITVTEDELCDLLEIILDNPKASNKFREYTLTALVKLSVKIEGVAQRIQGLIDSQTTIDAMEVQQRACEYSQILDKRWDTQRKGLLDSIPVSKKGASLLDSEYVGKEEIEEPVTKATFDYGKSQVAPKKVEKAGAQEAVKEKEAEKKVVEEPNLIDVLMGSSSSPEQVAPSAPQPSNTYDVLADIFGGIGSVQPSPPLAEMLQPVSSMPQPTIPQIAPTAGSGMPNLSELYGSSHTVPVSAPEPQPLQIFGGGQQLQMPPTHIPPVSNEADLFGDFQAPVQAAKTIPGYSDSNIQIYFEYSRSESDVKETIIIAHFKNLSSAEMTGVNLQIAVQKYLALKMEPISSPLIMPYNTPPVTQNLNIVNSMVGEKAIALKLRINYTIGLTNVSETQIVQFPKE